MADTTEVQPSTSNKAEGDQSKESQEAFDLLSKGRRDLLCGEVPQACQQLQEACRLLAKIYGEVATECGDAYLAYGTALLDLSRMESGVLGNALKGINSESEDESATSDDKVEDPENVSEKEKEDIGDQVIDAMLETDEEKKARETKETKKEADEKTSDQKDDKEGKNEKDKESGEKVEEKASDEKADKKADEKTESEAKSEKEAEKESVKESEKEKAEDEAMETEAKDEEKDTENEGEEEESEAIDTEEEKEEGTDGDAEEKCEEGTEKEADTSQDDVSNLQLAWEMLELAKVIFGKCESKDMKLKAADAHLKLGEVGLETEQYETSIEDFKCCLKIQQEFLDEESRLIAETHYQIGLACTFACRYEEALENYRFAIKVIETKIGKLKCLIEESEKSGKFKEKGSFDENVIIAEKEIKDLSEILPDIRAKIEDTEDEMKSQDKVKEMVKESVASDVGTTVGFGGETSKDSPKKAANEPVTDISHMVRKKRKAEDEPAAEESSKKACQEEDIKAGGDNAKTNGHVNGEADSKENGTTEKQNGTTEKQNGTTEKQNGTNGTTSPEKMETEIKTKTVEDVKKAAEEATA